MIEVRSLSYWYPRAKVPSLIDIDLRVEEGEFVVISGPSGCGKSTLCRAFNGLIPHFHGGRMGGEVIVDGTSTRQLRPSQLADRVGMVFQDPENQLVMTNVENELAFGMENLGFAPEVMRDRIMESGRQLDLLGFLDRYIPELSGGEKQKVALGSIIAMGPRFLVLDEPTSQLDAANADLFLGHVKRLNADLGIGVVLVEHRLERVLPHADRAILMSAGRIVFDGTPRKALSLMSSMGLCRGVARRANGTRTSDTGVLDARRLRFSYPGNRVIDDVDLSLGRSELVAITGANGAGKSTLLKLLVGLIEPDEGVVEWDGTSTKEGSVSERAAYTGYLGQNPNDYLFEETLEREMRFTLRNLGVPRREWGERMSWALDVVDLTRYRHSFPRDLSAGERERAALATVLVGRPKVLILDEPTRGLDLATKDKLADILHSLREGGMSTILVTHDGRFIAENATRLLRISDGRLEDMDLGRFMEGAEMDLSTLEAVR